MSIRFTAVHMSAGGYLHEHIADLKWVNLQDASSGESTRATLVKWIDDGNSAFVQGNTGAIPVETVHPSSGAAYLRTRANGVWSDNLLSLPRY
ncbi:hypothetical protein GALL_383450 [mine drainage metagenome]|uniref:DUF3892 domain-containing protein n=1 Tax=mine drainage metagenome TaxID=410659 RepID=A0A1J5Q957_9ZZZZ